MECQVCGRNKDEIKQEFQIEVEIEDHQGIKKCSKCIQEYERELGHEEKAVSDKSEPTGDWKDQLIA
jgi:rubredoxin